MNKYEAVRIARAAARCASWQGAEAAEMVKRYDQSQYGASDWADLILRRVLSWYPDDVKRYRALADSMA